jgi:hypothetical protein
MGLNEVPAHDSQYRFRPSFFSRRFIRQIFVEIPAMPPLVVAVDVTSNIPCMM